MTVVGNAFPEDVRRESAVRQLTAGRVLYLTCDFTNPKKDKFVVMVALEDPPLLLVVNSKVAAFINATPHLRDCQVTLHAADHDFLSHDSFLDCSQTVDSMSREEIVGQLVADLSRIKGELSGAARSQALEAIGRARTISDIHKRRILAALT